MTTRPRAPLSFAILMTAVVGLLAAAGPAFAQSETAVPDAPAPPRPPEGERIINFPSADVPRPGTLTLLFTHRFSQALEDSDIHSLYSFDSGADIGIGLAYAPVTNLDISLYRSSNEDTYELDAKYRVFSAGPFAAAVRAGGDWRTVPNIEKRFSFFGQAILAVTIGSRIRLTAIPTYVSRIAGNTFLGHQPFYESVFNLGGAVSIAVTRTMNIQGEVMARRRKTEAEGVAWIASIEKTVPRHRFAFTVGNQRTTTVDQYVTWTPQFFGQSSHRFFIGFNIVRQWKL
ncbi:MAG: DUF5777 family beta-barrel protein [Acidobacteriota bacterium]|nr:DUF5777 family beta-barrel protein [Acidobacteriota bacterium]